MGWKDTEEGESAERHHRSVRGFILRVKRSLAVIIIKLGEVKGDWLVSGEGTLAGVTQALQEPQCGAALTGSGEGGARGTGSRYLSPQARGPNH